MQNHGSPVAPEQAEFLKGFHVSHRSTAESCARGKRGHAAIFDVEVSRDSDTETFLEKRTRLSSTPVVPYSNSVVYDTGVLAVADTAYDTFVHANLHSPSTAPCCSVTTDADSINCGSHDAVALIHQHQPVTSNSFPEFDMVF